MFGAFKHLIPLGNGASPEACTEKLAVSRSGGGFYQGRKKKKPLKTTPKNLKSFSKVLYIPLDEMEWYGFMP